MGGEPSNNYHQAVKQDQLPPAKEYVEVFHTAILIPVTEGQPEALYVYKSRGFGGEIGVNGCNFLDFIRSQTGCVIIFSTRTLPTSSMAKAMVSRLNQRLMNFLTGTPKR